jgi:GNAT superfamily N-acetyltransferase
MGLAVERFSEGEAFRAAAEDFLLRDEVRNALFLGLIERFGVPGSAGVGAGYVVRADGAVVLAALFSDARGVTLGDGPPAASHALADALLDELEPARVVAANGVEPSVDAFVARWCPRTGARAEDRMRTRLHRLDAVRPLDRPASGRLRRAGDADGALCERWTQAFAADTGTLPPPPGTAPHLAQGRLRLWDDRAPVAMAAWSRPTPRGCSISLVYTPPEHRGCGYASALVAALSQERLDAGKSFCTLFTDRANPTANRIYARIGYESVADYRLVGLAVPARGTG